jgi:hypothetical protein
VERPFDLAAIIRRTTAADKRLHARARAALGTERAALEGVSPRTYSALGTAVAGGPELALSVHSTGGSSQVP